MDSIEFQLHVYLSFTPLEHYESTLRDLICMVVIQSQNLYW